MTIFFTIFRFFVFTILLIGGPKFHQFGPIVTQMNGADRGSPKITLSYQTMKFLIKIFETQSATFTMGYLATPPLYYLTLERPNPNWYHNAPFSSKNSFQFFFLTSIRNFITLYLQMIWCVELRSISTSDRYFSMSL